MMFLTYFIVALAMGHLAARLRAQQEAERRREQRATALYLLTRELAQATDFADLLAIVIREVGKSCSRRSRLVAAGGKPQRDRSPLTLPAPGRLPEKEQSVADWAFRRTANPPVAAPTPCPRPRACICRWWPATMPLGYSACGSETSPR